MAFKIKQSKKAVNSLEIYFMDESHVEFFFRKPNQLELIEFELAVDEFLIEFDEKHSLRVKAEKAFKEQQESYDKFQEGIEGELTEEQKVVANEFQKQIDLIEIDYKRSTFAKPESRHAVIEQFMLLVTSSKGIVNEAGVDIDFLKLEDEDKEDVLNQIPNIYLKIFTMNVRNSVSLSPLG